MNKQVRLAKRPFGLPQKDTWNFVESDIPTIAEGEFLVKQHYISLDPAMRGWLNDAKSYIPPVAIDAVMRAGSVGEIVESKNPHFKKGMHVAGNGGVQQYAVGGRAKHEGWYPVDPTLVPLPTYIGTLGMPGMTAYFGLLEVGKPKAGDVVLVSGGAGAVGSVVGQVAKIKGCHVVGIAGGQEKCNYMREVLGYDGVIDYKNESVREAIKRECPKGIDVYFDNVGGDILDHALARLRKRARVVLCGAISQYNNTTAIQGPKNYLNLLVTRSSMTGIVVFDWADRYQEGAAQMAQWMMAGKLIAKEDVYEGIEHFHETFLRLFNGEKKGKLVLKVS